MLVIENYKKIYDNFIFLKNQINLSEIFMKQIYAPKNYTYVCFFDKINQNNQCKCN